MAKAIIQTGNLTFAKTGLGTRGDSIGSVKTQTHDGDTINVRLMGNFGVRFLGIDAPETSTPLPGESAFKSISNPDWELFLADPFNEVYPDVSEVFDPELVDFLQQKAVSGAALNHYEHAKAAERGLEEEIEKDMQEMGKTNEDFEMFIAFAYEILDRYGRLLGYINRYQQKTDTRARPLSYNERLLKRGLVLPYFIWPNINPFRKFSSLTEAAFGPEQMQEMVHDDRSLSNARTWVKEARKNNIGLFEEGNTLVFEASELRFLSRRVPPNRWIIDMSSDSNELVDPQKYWQIFPEDRLFIPPEFVPLFVEKGWIL